MIRVLVADDHEVVRAGLCSLLELAPDIALVGEAASGRETVQKVLELRPDVLLLDVQMPDGDGLSVLSELASRQLATASLVLTTFDDETWVREAIRAGARGYLLKNVKLGELLRAVRSLSQGGTAYSPGVTEEVRQRILVAAPAPAKAATLDVESMTPREHEVLRLLAGGYSNREIAEVLRVAEGTVKNHVSNILAKMGVRDRTRAVLKAAERGYLAENPSKG